MACVLLRCVQLRGYCPLCLSPDQGQVNLNSLNWAVCLLSWIQLQGLWTLTADHGLCPGPSWGQTRVFRSRLFSRPPGVCPQLGPGGTTEKARTENAAPSKMQGWKTRERKTRHQMAGVEMARTENAAPKCSPGWKRRENVYIVLIFS